MSEYIRALIQEMKQGVEAIYKERVTGMYLYGSYARGEEERESDVDILIVLNRIDHYASEVGRTGQLVSNLSLKYGVSISPVFVAQNAWAEGDTNFLANVREEAVAA